MALDLFAPGTTTALVLVACRVGGLLLVAPTLSAVVIPKQVRAGILVLLTIVLTPTALATYHGASLSIASFVSETFIGFALGLGAAILVAAAEAAGDAMAVQIGLNGAAILDPAGDQPAPILGAFTRMFAVAVLLTFDLHGVMIRALAQSFTLIPAGTPGHLAEGAKAMVISAGALFALGIRFAAPVIAAILVVNVALATLGRAAPQLNVLSLSFPIQIAIGLAAFLTALPAIATFLSGWTSVYAGIVGGPLTTYARP
ncbi:MAG: flagellar biosynthetic protein FliR [Gemmatimonadaceae bacterium]|nr:flagellar biosynthetic protein FliR [Gemmatimonadaceae bacterium]